MAAVYDVTVSEEKVLSRGKVNTAVWSSRVDIIAIGGPNGSVSLHRFNFVFGEACPRFKLGLNWEAHCSEAGAVVHLAWRQDGTVLAVAHESGNLRFLNLRDGSLLHSLVFKSTPIRQLCWTFSEHKVTPNRNIFPPFDSLSVFTDDLFSNRQEVVQVSQPWFDPSTKPSVLAVLLADNTVRFFGCGFYELASLNLSASGGKIISCYLSKDFSSFGYFAVLPSGLLTFNKVPSPALAKHAISMRNISLHIGSLMHYKQLLLWSLKQLQSAWENTLLELDTKLTAYSRERLLDSKTWSLRNELMEIILFGHIAPPLREFFKRKWKPTAVRRAGIAMFKAYDSMKAITFQQLQYILMRLICEASELLGCVRDSQNCACFGIPEDLVIDLIREAGSTLQKAQELHLVVNHCSQYLRPFFQWLHGVAQTNTKDTIESSQVKFSPTERNLVITFVAERLRPFFVDGQLKSYQIELVEQYIRKGGITKSVDELLGIQASANTSLRAKLKEIIPLPQLAELKHFPEGIFTSSRSSLADLIEDNLSGCIDKLAFCGGKQQSLLFNEPEAPMPLLANVTDASSLHICHFPHVSQRVDNVSGDYPADRFAFVQPRDQTISSSYDTVFVYSRDTNGVNRAVGVIVDGFVGDENSRAKPYNVADLKFFHVDTLAALIYRESDDNPVETLQWMVFFSARNLLASAPLVWTLGLQSATELTLSNVASQNPMKLSSVVTEARQVHALPQKPSWFTLNAERHTIFVMFDNTCRVFIMDPIEADDNEGEE